ncbi:hypothetical protein ACGF5C_23370 [Micromonospora sp. NPDC047620]|uniref:hypothetical protein n=1 Tax=Micromonospora sp. NPDC047620 TaxID=3364251 RepID=UPI00371ECA81
MQEQPPREPARREPAEGARRRSPKPTFTPPPAPPEPAPPAPAPARQAEDAEERPRRVKPAPAVLFQPPADDPPLPRQADRSAGPASREHADQAGTVGRSDVPHTGGTDPVTTGATRQGAPTDVSATTAGTNGPGEETPAGPVAAQAPDASGEGSPAPAAADRTRRATPASKNPAKKAAAGPPVEEAAATRATTPVRKAAAGTATPANKTGAKKTAKKTPARKTAATKTPPAEQPREAVDLPPAATADTTAATKVTPARKATTARKAAPARTAADAGPASTPSDRTPEPALRKITSRVLGHPGFAPELLALAAVQVLGPRARDWAQGLRDAYPDAGADGLARLATRRFVRQAGAGGATAALAGVFAPLAELAAVLWTQANLVLHLAAAYGRDPAHPDRAVELLVLTRVHPDAGSAAAALAAARAADGPGEAPWSRAAEAAWRLAAPLAAQAGGWLALRAASRLLPGAAVLAAAAGDAAGAERLAARAITAYRRTAVG